MVEATITRLTKFGAFARITDETEGLIHISEISDEHIAHPKEILHEGDLVTLRIIKIEPDSHRIGLSLRRVESLAYADMDLKALEKELDDPNIAVTSDDAKAEETTAEEVEAEEPSAEEETTDEVTASEEAQPEGESSAEKSPAKGEPKEEEPAPKEAQAGEKASAEKPPAEEAEE